MIGTAIPFISYTAARLADQGLANTLGLVTLRHGTNVVSWLGIHILGALPEKGKSRIGGDAQNGYKNDGKFFFAREYNEERYFWQLNKEELKELFAKNKEVSEFPKIYAACSTINLLSQLHFPRPISQFMVSMAKRLSLGIFIPSIKFRLTPEAEKELSDDPTYYGLKADYTRYSRACYTTKQISPLNIGLIGTLKNAKLGSCENPQKAAIGLTQLFLAAAMISLTSAVCPGFLEKYKYRVIIPALIAVV